MANIRTPLVSSQLHQVPWMSVASGLGNLTPLNGFSTMLSTVYCCAWIIFWSNSKPEKPLCVNYYDLAIQLSFQCSCNVPVSSKVLIERFVFCLQCSVIIADQCGLKLITAPRSTALGWDEGRRSVMLCFSWENITCKVLERHCMHCKVSWRLVFTVCCAASSDGVSRAVGGEAKKTEHAAKAWRFSAVENPARQIWVSLWNWSERERVLTCSLQIALSWSRMCRAFCSILGRCCNLSSGSREIFESRFFSASSKRAPRRICSCNGCTF